MLNHKTCTMTNNSDENTVVDYVRKTSSSVEFIFQTNPKLLKKNNNKLKKLKKMRKPILYFLQDVFFSLHLI